VDLRSSVQCSIVWICGPPCSVPLCGFAVLRAVFHCVDLRSCVKCLWWCYAADYVLLLTLLLFLALGSWPFAWPPHADAVSYGVQVYHFSWISGGNLEMSGNSAEAREKTQSQGKVFWLWQLDKITHLYFIHTVINFLYVLFTENWD